MTKLQIDEIPSWSEDLSKVWKYLNDMKSSGISDFRMYFIDHPEDLVRCRSLIRYYDMNNAAFSLFGISDLHVLQEKQFRFFIPESLFVFGDMVNAFLDGETEFQGEMEICDLSSARRTISLSASKISEHTQFPDDVRILCTDVTVRNQNAKEKQDTLFFLEKMSVYANTPLMVWDCSLTVVVYNAALAHLTGMNPDQVIGQKITVLFPEEYLDKIQKLIRKAEEGVEWEGVIIPLTQKTGQVREILWNSAQVIDSSGRPIATIVQGLDVTEQRWAIEYMERYIAELTNANAELEKMRYQLEESNHNLDEKVRSRTNEIEKLLKQKDEFITQIGHDLKTPLTPILALIPVLLNKESDPKKKMYLETVNRNASHLHTLLTSIIRMAHLNKSYRPRTGTEIPVYQMITELIINFEFEILKKRLLVENQVPDDIRIWINPIDFDTIFGNLLDNAIRFTAQGGNIRITGDETDMGVTVTITDSGIGLNHEDKNRIFEKFYKADSSRHDGKSFGLGLSITKDIIERNGGFIQVHSEGKGKGSSFNLVFPNMKRIRELKDQTSNNRECKR
jgi:PAS domain S-box-containing protein